MTRLAVLCVLAFTASFGASAQLISVGVKGAVPLLELAVRNDESRRYIVGPSVEVKLPAGFAVEADALYQRLGSNSSYNSVAVVTSSNEGATSVVSTIVTISNRLRGNSWEFPVLGKYYFRHRVAAWQPFAGAGFSFRTIGIEAQGTAPSFEQAVPVLRDFKSTYRSPLDVGAPFAAGLRYQAGRFSVAPEIRYTRWGGNSSLTRKNALGVFLGIAF